MAVQKMLTLDEFQAFLEQRQDDDTIYELIEGEVVEVSPNFQTSVIASRILAPLFVFVEARNLGYVTGADGGYKVSASSEFNPDVGFISKQRLPQMPQGAAPLPPDFAVEVISPSDLKHENERITKKLRIYQQLKIALLWYVYPHRQEVEVYEYGKHVRTVGIQGALDGSDVLPGFSLTVRAIFAQ